MTINFHAEHVTYGEAIGGDLVQVTFLEHDEDDADYDEKKQISGTSTIKYIMVSMLYDFPGDTPTMEWNDGTKDNGGANIERVTMSKGFLRVWIDSGLDFAISFVKNEEAYENIREFFERHYDL